MFSNLDYCKGQVILINFSVTSRNPLFVGRIKEHSLWSHCSVNWTVGAKIKIRIIMSTLQLEFSQAMTDFKKMFPDIDREVIEAILRANLGAVDQTIDALLAMSIDNQVSGGACVY